MCAGLSSIVKLHHLPDFWKGIALQRVAAVLRPGGIFFLRDLVYSFDPADAAQVIAAWLAHGPHRPEEGYTAGDLATHVRTEYSTYTWPLQPMLERAGFEVRDADYAGQVFAAYTCAASRHNAASLPDLDATAAYPWDGEPVTLRWITVHMIREYARHTGHADLPRERIDSATGE